MRYLLLACALCGLALSDINVELDGWLKDWYSPRLVFKTGLGPLEVSWTEGRLWWTKARTLKCGGGLLELSGGVRRTGWAQVRVPDNSSREWVAADLGLVSPARVAFYRCGLDNSTDGIISASLATPQGGIHLLFTFRSEYWWCTVRTLSLAVGLNGLEVQDLSLDGLSAALPEDVQRDLQRNILKQAANVIHENWKVVGNGPKCKDIYCKT